MKPSRLPSKSFTVAVLFATAVLLAVLPSAKADYLSWTNTALKTGAMKSGFDFAVSALHAESAGNIQRKASEVTGTIGKTYVAITCVGTVPRITAVVAVVGPDNTEAMRVRDAVSHRIAGVVNFD